MDGYYFDYNDLKPHTIDGIKTFLPTMKPLLPPHSDRMREVLILFFKSEYPYRLYSQIAKDATPEDDNAFDADIKVLEAYFTNHRKASDV